MDEKRREKADRLLSLLRDGMTLRAAAREVGMAASTALDWTKEYPDFGEQYARAREAGYRVMADQIIDIADETDDPNKARVQVDARKWLLAKALPKVYGERLSHQVEGGITVVLQPAEDRL